MKSSLFLSMVLMVSSTAPVFAQVANVPADDLFGAQNSSKIANVDILTDSPTMRINGGAPAQLGAQYNFQSAAVQQQPIGYGEINPGLGIQQNEAVNSIAQQMGGGLQQQMPMQQGQLAQVQQGAGAQAQAQKAPMQIDGQAVGRMVGVAGTALMLGAFFKSGGMGGMMNSFGFNNRFRGQVSGW